MSRFQPSNQNKDSFFSGKKEKVDFSPLTSTCITNVHKRFNKVVLRIECQVSDLISFIECTDWRRSMFWSIFGGEI